CCSPARLAHLRARLFQAHQQPHHAHGFRAAEADQFESAARTRTVILLIVLSAPGGESAVHTNLAFEDAGDAVLEGPPRSLAALRSHELVKVRGVGVAQELHQTDHGIVVEGDVPVIATRRRKKLRPATAGILRLEDVVDALLDRGPAALVLGGLADASQETQLVGSGAVIEGGLELFAVAAKGSGGGVDVLGPAAGVGLV